MENKNIEKIYFVPGNLVVVKHELDNKPVMLVTEIVTTRIGLSNGSIWGGSMYGSAASSSTQPSVLKQPNTFKGIRCGWFDDHQVWHEHIFSTKDLIKVEEGE